MAQARGVGCRGLWSAAVVCCGLWLTACSAIPGVSRQEQEHNVDQLVERALADVMQKHPQAKDELARAVGYAVMDNTLTKIPVFGAGRGYGVAIDKKSGQKTYLRMRRFDFGAGWGLRNVRPVLIFFDAEKFKHFADGSFELQLAAEASAKVDERGVAGAMDGRRHEAGYTIYMLTDNGVSATWALGFIRVKPVSLKDAD